MAHEDPTDEEVVDALFQALRDDAPPPSDALPDRTLRRVQASITSRDLVDLVTLVFLVRFCAPMIDLVAALFGHTPGPRDRSEDHE